MNRPRRRWSRLLVLILGTACADRSSYSDFPVVEVGSALRGASWVVLATDVAGDGERNGYGDGKSLSFHYDSVGDTLWFRLELYGGFSAEQPAVSVAVDLDADQTTGRNWYGSNEGFRFDVVASIGPRGTHDSLYRGYNGITDTLGVRTGDWMNRQQGGLALRIDPLAQTYYLGVRRSDLSAELERFQLIGSVGQRARWNDDIGESGYATVDLATREGQILDDQVPRS